MHSTGTHPPQHDDPLLTIGQVAKRLNVALNTVRNAILAGHLTAYLLPGKGRGTYRIPASAVRTYLTDHQFHPRRERPRTDVRGRPFRHLLLDGETRR